MAGERGESMNPCTQLKWWRRGAGKEEWVEGRLRSRRSRRSTVVTETPGGRGLWIRMRAPNVPRIFTEGKNGEFTEKKKKDSERIKVEKVAMIPDIKCILIHCKEVTVSLLGFPCNVSKALIFWKH